MIRAIFIPVGALIILLSAAWLYTTWSWGATASEAQGMVQELNAGGSHPEIVFETEEGQRVTFPQGGLIFGYEVGDSVNVLFNPADPAQATLNTFGARYGFPVLGFILGMIFIGAGVLKKGR